LPLSRYIHSNPIRTRRFEKAEFSKKCDYLKNSEIEETIWPNPEPNRKIVKFKDLTPFALFI